MILVGVFLLIILIRMYQRMINKISIKDYLIESHDNWAIVCTIAQRDLI